MSFFRNKHGWLRKLYSFHKWLGLTTGFFLVLIGLSGSVLVFRPELERMLYGAEHKVVHEAAETVSLEKVYTEIIRMYPRLDGLAWMNPGAAPDEAWAFRLYLNDERLSSYDLGALYINPYTREVIQHGRNDDLEVGWMEWLYQFHFSLHLGTPGAAFVALLGIFMILSVITGGILYRKFFWKVLFFRVKLRTGNRRVFLSGLHRIVGVWSLMLNILIAFTGLWMNLFAFAPGSWGKEVLPTPPNTRMKVSADLLLGDAMSKMPELEAGYVYLPVQPGKYFSVRGPLKGQSALLSSSNSIVMDPLNGEVREINRFSGLGLVEKAEALFYPLHIGCYGGILVKILYVLVGLSPGILSLSGFLLWSYKR